MRIATWNINGMRARLEFFVQWLRERKPDIVGLQEIKATNDQFPHDRLEAEGYSAVVHGQKAWNGVAIVSRKPVTVTQAGLTGEEEQGARFITATVEQISFTTIYVPNGKTITHEDFARKLTWLDTLIEILRRDRAEERVLCGDFNICPGPIDSWNEAQLEGTIFHTHQERNRFKQLLDTGLVDVFREKHPELQAFSWWDYRGGAFHRKQGLRIDFVLASAGLLPTVRSVEIDRDFRKKKGELTPSDHAPVIVDIE